MPPIACATRQRGRHIVHTMYNSAAVGDRRSHGELGIGSVDLSGRGPMLGKQFRHELLTARGDQIAQKRGLRAAAKQVERRRRKRGHGERRLDRGRVAQQQAVRDRVQRDAGRVLALQFKRGDAVGDKLERGPFVCAGCCLAARGRDALANREKSLPIHCEKINLQCSISRKTALQTWPTTPPL